MVRGANEQGVTSFLTATERIFDALRRRIVSGELAPGERLVPAAIAKEFDVSPMPVRDALKVLETHGLAEGRPGLGYRVVHLTPARYEGLRYLRRAVECEAVRLCALRAGTHEVGELEELARRVDALKHGRDDNVELEEKEFAFHRRLAEIVGHPELVGTLDRVLAMIGTVSPEMPESPESHHEHIVTAIASGDPDEAEAAMRRHLTRPEH